MADEKYGTHIMLDLECVAVRAHNPVIIQIGAICFNQQTGEEHGTFSEYVNYQSCLDKGLVEDKDTLKWVQQNIPGTLRKSKIDPAALKLQLAVDSFTHFIKTCCAATVDANPSRFHSRDSHPVIWGNGPLADNIWIRSCYEACGLREPWHFADNRCVRTVLKLAGLKTGINYARESETPFVGTKHVAIDDCRHQIRYFTKAISVLMGREPPVPPRSIPISALSSKKKQVVKPSPKKIISPNTSFSASNPVPQDLLDIAAMAYRDPVESFSTSFSESQESIETQTDAFLSPNTSFSAPSADSQESTTDYEILKDLSVAPPVSERVAVPRDQLQGDQGISNQASRRQPRDVVPSLLKRKSDALESED